MIKRVSEFQTGEKGTIVSLEQDGKLAFRLEELGFIPGSKIECIRRASCQGPILIRLRGYCLSAQMKDVENIQVEVFV